MKSFRILAVVGLIAGCAGGGGSPGTAERLYVFNCGESRTTDVSRWSPGVNVGQPREFSSHCYLIKHAKGLMIWDSGFAESIAAMPNGLTTPLMTVRVPKRLSDQLKEIGVSPSLITHVAFSHTHGDHVGNANLFTAATLYMQEAEYDAAFGPNASKFNFVSTNYDKLRANPVVKLKGDHDVFGDGSVTLLSTPGHTPGHQSLLVRLPKTGAIVLSGDVVHFQENWEARRVPSMNFNGDQSVQSMQRVAAVMETHKAQLWINHDKPQSMKIAKSPSFHD